MRFKFRILAKALAGLGMIALSGCTTSALSSVSTVADPVPLALPVAAGPDGAVNAGDERASQEPIAETSRYDPVALAPDAIPPAQEMGANREEAIRMIRAKAANLPGEKPNVFDTAPAAGWKRTPQEVEAVRLQMQEAARRNSGVVSEREISARAAEAERLKSRAQRHYNDALKEIEN